MTGITCRPVTCALCGSSDYKPSAAGRDYEYQTADQMFHMVRCRRCGHEYLNPRPTPDDLPKAYPPHYYTLSGRHTRRFSPVIGRLKSLVVGRRLRAFNALFKRGGSVLEVGCGDGSLLIDLKRRYPDLSLTGMDFSVSPDTEDRLAASGIRLIRGRVEDTDLGDQTYDLIIMNQVIEHVPDPSAVLAHLARSLRPFGFISIETPNRNGYDRRFFRASFWGGYYFPRHLHLFDEKSLRVLLHENGLPVAYHGYLLAPIIWTFSVHAALDQWPGCRRPALFFTDKNPLCLALFTSVDLLARLFGLPTSNQKFIAQKRRMGETSQRFHVKHL
ncbi:hypothetical protein JCM14469_41720 [Desulfatiferula olefinivorans]